MLLGFANSYSDEVLPARNLAEILILVSAAVGSRVVVLNPSLQVVNDGAGLEIVCEGLDGKDIWCSPIWKYDLMRNVVSDITAVKQRD